MRHSLELSTIRAGEVLSYAAGILFLGFFLVQIAQGEIQRRIDVSEFTSMAKEDTVLIPAIAVPDTSLWAPGRIADYNTSLDAELPPVMGTLSIPSVGLEVAVYPSDSQLLMDRGSGVIDGMSYPHEPGNIGIAGHRDGYFRILEDVRPGQRLLLETLEGTKNFVINATHIVEANDVSLLQDTQEQTVTLVTCYPFYFVGHAPQRYIVTASLDLTNTNQQ